MIQCNNTNIQKVKINFVGNRIAGEKIVYSSSSVVCDDLTKNLLGRYLLKDITYSKLYHFTHDVDITYNKVYSLVFNVFADIESFDNSSNKISKVLYNLSKDKTVNSGYLFVVLFKGCIYENKNVNAVGIFKTEQKDIFLKIQNQNSTIEVTPEQGFSIGNLGKGCIIFNIEKEDGFRIVVLNKSRSKASEKYWIKDFLGCEPVLNDYLNTQVVLNALAQYIKGQNTDSYQKAAEMCKTINIANQGKIEIDNLISRLSTDPKDKTKIEAIYGKLIGKDIKLPSVITVNKDALKKTRLKSSLKLDDNFEISFHGGDELIETGTDPNTGLNYIKLLYRNIK